MRIGIGYDIHTLVEGRPLFLGGVEVPFNKGLSGHSDADVLLHALCDAILGALALGDIGTHFPNNDPAYRGIKSIELLKKVHGMIKGRGYSVSNIDTTIIAEKPKITPFAADIKREISKTLNIDSSCVSVKATTNEGADSIGKGEAIASIAVAALVKE